MLNINLGILDNVDDAGGGGGGYMQKCHCRKRTSKKNDWIRDSAIRSDIYK